MTWAERIPAAIEKAENLISRRLDSYKGRRDFTPVEVALAKALWTIVMGRNVESIECNDEKCLACVVNKPIRAFVEKVEAL